MKFTLVFIILSIKSSSYDSEALTDELPNKLTMYTKDFKLRHSSSTQGLESLIGDFEEDGLVSLQKERTELISKDPRIKKYKIFFDEGYDYPVTVSPKIELKRSEYPWLEKLQKLIILDKNMGIATDELYYFLDTNVWLEELLISGDIYFTDDVPTQTIKIENAKPPDLPLLSTLPNNNNEDLPFNNIAEKLNSSVDKIPNQLELPKNIDHLVVSNEQQVSLDASRPSIKNESEFFLPQKSNPDNSNIQVFYEFSTTHPESNTHARRSQNSSTKLDITPKHSGQTRQTVSSVKHEQPFNKPYQDFDINMNSAESSKKHFENLKRILLSQRPPILNDKITQHVGPSITHTLVEKRKINDLKLKPDKTQTPFKTDFKVQDDKFRRANFIKAEKETSKYRKNGDLVKVKDDLKNIQTKKKSKKLFRRKKKIVAVKKKDKRDISNLQKWDDINIYSPDENNHDFNTSKHPNGSSKNVSSNDLKFPSALEKKFIVAEHKTKNFEEDERLKASEPNNAFFRSNYSSAEDDTEAQKVTQNNDVKPQYNKTKVVKRRFLLDKNSFHKDKSQDDNIKPVDSTFNNNKSSAHDTEHKLVFNNENNQLKSVGSSQNIAFQNQLSIKFTFRRKRL